MLNTILIASGRTLHGHICDPSSRVVLAPLAILNAAVVSPIANALRYARREPAHDQPNRNR
jgi:hypothetical protein